MDWLWINKGIDYELDFSYFFALLFEIFGLFTVLFERVVKPQSYLHDKWILALIECINLNAEVTEII